MPWPRAWQERVAIPSGSGSGYSDRLLSQQKLPMATQHPTAPATYRARLYPKMATSTTEDAAGPTLHPPNDVSLTPDF